MNDRCEGIVIAQTPYKDNDVILTVYTEQFGKIALYGKGLNKSAAKNSYATQIFDLSEFLFDFNETKKTHLLKSATLINEFKNIKQDYNLMVLASNVTEIACKIDEDENIYQLLYDTLFALDNRKMPYMVFSLYLSEILKRFGLSPEVDECVVCGDKTAIQTISIDDGGFICAQCNRETHYPRMDKQLLYAFRLINKASFDVLDKLYDLQLDMLSLAKVMMEFFLTHSGVVLKSYRSFTQLQ